MGTRRMMEIPGFGIDRVAAAVGEDPDVLRLENLDTDLVPPESALRATREAVGEDDANSWLPFTGKADLRRAVADQFRQRSGIEVDPDAQVTITCGDGDAMVDALFITTDPGDEVILAAARGLLTGALPMIRARGCTLVGVTLTNLAPDDAVQLALPFGAGRAASLDATLDAVKERFGADAITRALLLGRGRGISVPLLPD
jgi:DNA-binding transcriptional MocR family regulator